MNRFFALYKKEIKELVTFQTILMLFVFVALFFVLGNFMSDVTSDEMDKMGMVAVLDNDQSALSEQSLALLEQANYKLIPLDGNDQFENLKQADKEDLSSYLEIPKGFEQAIQAGTAGKLSVVSRLESFSVLGSSDGATQAAAELINEELSTLLLTTGAQGLDPLFIKNPTVVEDNTVVADKSAVANPSMLRAFAMQQSMMIPIIVFLLITYSSQMTISAISSEKTDKTLETLLSAPVSRLAVLSSKMCAAGTLAFLMAAVYMLGFSRYMGSMMGGETMDSSGISTTLNTLGLNLGAGQYALVGIQLFLTILIALAASVVLGALAKDVKAAQSLSMPIMFLAMIPYFVSMMLDINSLPLAARAILSLIPFTHAFTAVPNLTFGHYDLFFGGMIYQVVLLILVMAIAVHIFSTDKIFTMTIGLEKKKRRAN